MITNDCSHSLDHSLVVRDLCKPSHVKSFFRGVYGNDIPYLPPFRIVRITLPPPTHNLRCRKTLARNNLKGVKFSLVFS